MPVRLTWTLDKAITREICNLQTDSPNLPCAMQVSRSSWNLKTWLHWGNLLSLVSPREKSELWRRGLRQSCDHHPKRPSQITQAPAAQCLQQQKGWIWHSWRNLIKWNPTCASKPPMKKPACSGTCQITLVALPFLWIIQHTGFLKRQGMSTTGSGCEVSLKRRVTTGNTDV